jgi:hypothetical protein
MDTDEYEYESGESDISEEAMSTGDGSEPRGSDSGSESSDPSSVGSDIEADPLEDHELDGFADY